MQSRFQTTIFSVATGPAKEPAPLPRKHPETPSRFQRRLGGHPRVPELAEINLNQPKIGRVRPANGVSGVRSSLESPHIRPNTARFEPRTHRLQPRFRTLQGPGPCAIRRVFVPLFVDDSTMILETTQEVSFPRGADASVIGPSAVFRGRRWRPVVRTSFVRTTPSGVSLVPRDAFPRTPNPLPIPREIE